MERRTVAIDITDHVIVRWLEREMGLDVSRLRQHLAGAALDGAELGAQAVKLGKVRMILRDSDKVENIQVVAVTTAIPLLYMRVPRR